MLANALRTAYGYNRWATGRILEAAAGLTPEQLHAPGTAGHGSIRDTLLHVMATQKGWISWWDGSMSLEQSYGFALDPKDYPDVPSLQAYWADLERQTQAFLSRLTDDEAARVVTASPPNGMQVQMPMWGMLLHLVNHGTQHRSEAAAMLTAFGRSPGPMDLLMYLFEPGAWRPT